ncbi:MAG TPA: protein kinase [Planctomycetota bacterium]|nr:protein kinase [Planctomycetota bacterium]
MDSDDPLIGKELGHCTLQRKLGQGGMGAVYLAHHPGLNKAVAIKVLPGDLASTPEFRERFIREARLAARLEHPNVVPVYDVGHEQGVHYIAMQFVEGKSLDVILKERKKLAVGEALSTTKRVAAALAAAAKLGIVHRDIKPHNILISKDGVVKVADFGLAKDEDSNRSISEPGTVMGTPYYMSPEQAKGEHVDHRSDLFSLGATLYHMLTGKRLFDGGSPVTIVMKQASTEEPIPARQLEPSIPLPVDAFLSKLLQKDPANRYQTADDAIRALDGLRQPAGSIPPGKVPLAPPRRTAAVIALPITGILLIGIIVGLVLGRSGKPMPPPVDPPAAKVPDKAKATANVPETKPEDKPVEKPGEKPAEKPAPKPSEEKPTLAKEPTAREKILARIKDATEKRLTEEVMGRTEELMKALQGKDPKAIRAFLDDIAFGLLSDQQVLEIFAKNPVERYLERWEIQDVEIRMRVPGARPQPHAQALMTYDFKFNKVEMKVTDQTIHWIRKLDGKWYVTRLPKTGK